METLNWSELGFGYIKTDYNIRCYYRDGKWGELEVCSSEILRREDTCVPHGRERQAYAIVQPGHQDGGTPGRDV